MAIQRDHPTDGQVPSSDWTGYSNFIPFSQPPAAARGSVPDLEVQDLAEVLSLHVDFWTKGLACKVHRGLWSRFEPPLGGPRAN